MDFPNRPRSLGPLISSKEHSTLDYALLKELKSRLVDARVHGIFRGDSGGDSWLADNDGLGFFISLLC